jgi:hypothetical protein
MQGKPTVKQSVLVFSGYYVVLMVLVGAALWALDAFAQIAIDNRSVGWVPVIVAAMQTGQFYGGKAGSKPGGGYCWLVAAGFLLASLAISTVALWALALANGIAVIETVRQILADMAGQGIGAMFILMMFLGLFLFLLIVLRFVFSLGAGQGVKLAATRRAR